MDSSSDSRHSGFNISSFIKRRSVGSVQDNGRAKAGFTHSKSLSFKTPSSNAKRSLSPLKLLRKKTMSKSNSFPANFSELRKSLSPEGSFRTSMDFSDRSSSNGIELPSVSHVARRQSTDDGREREYMSVKKKLMGVYNTSRELLPNKHRSRSRPKDDEPNKYTLNNGYSSDDDIKYAIDNTAAEQMDEDGVGDDDDDDDEDEDYDAQFKLHVDSNTNSDKNTDHRTLTKVEHVVSKLGRTPNVLVNGTSLRVDAPFKREQGTVLASSTPEKKKADIVVNDEITNFTELTPNSKAKPIGINKENSIDHDENTGLFSKFLSSFNLKSFSDLTEDPHMLRHIDTRPNETSSDDENDAYTNLEKRATNTSSGAHSITFKPVKKTVLQTIGDGSLTLDEFPNTSNPNQRSPTLSGSTHPINDTINNLLNPKAITSPDAAKSVPMMNISSSPTGQTSTLSNKGDSKSINHRYSTNPQESELARNRLRQATVTIAAAQNSSSENDNSNANAPTSTNPNSLDVSQQNKKSLVLYEKKKLLYTKKFDVDIPNEKKQRAFHLLFPDLPNDELLIDEFGCAYKKDILIQGKMYLTEHNICFHSNIIGLVTHLTLPLIKIYKMQKRKTVKIPNSIEFSNLHETYFFASFRSRDIVYSLINKVWKSNKTLYAGTSDQDLILGIDQDDLESVDPLSDGQDYGDDDDSLYEQDENDNNELSKKDPTNNAVDDNNDSDSSLDEANMIKEGEEDEDEPKNITDDEEKKFYGLSFRGPKTHAPTKAPYKEEPGDVKILEDTIKAPVGVVYSLLFGDDTSFLKQIILKQGNRDVSVVPKFVSNERKYEYIKPLNAPVGPKQTRCLVEESVDRQDFNDFCLVVQSTASPDVPSGNVFKVKTRLWFSWAKNDETNILIVTSVIWSGKSWIKGVVEKNTYSGQKEALGIMVTEVKKKIEQLKSQSTSSSKKRRKSTKQEIIVEKEEVAAKEEDSIPTAIEQEQGWLDFIIGQFDIKTGIILLLLFWMIISNVRSNKSPHCDIFGPSIYNKNNLLVSESELWEWIEHRESKVNAFQRRGLNVKEFQNKLKNQDLKEEIKFEEKKLKLLKDLSI